MRVSTNQFHNQGIDAIQKHQSDILAIQEKMSTGKRINKPSDDPVGMNQVHNLKKTISQIETYKKNGDYAKSQLGLEETQIQTVIDGVQRARELTIQMMNDSYNPANRKATGAEIGQLIEHIRNVMNSKNPEKELLFAGNNVNVSAAFVDDTVNAPLSNGSRYTAYIGSTNAGANYDQKANYGARFVQIGFDANNQVAPDDKGDPARVRTTDNGAKVFDVPTATSLPAGVDKNVLNVMIQLKDYLDKGQQPPPDIASDFTKALDHMSGVMAEIGGRQNRIQTQKDAGQSFKMSLDERRSKIEEMDVVQGIADFTKKQNALQMAQQIFSKVQKMSLFNYIR